MNRPQGEITRGTTNPNRLRRVDRWIAARITETGQTHPLVVDLGYGATPTTTVELAHRLKPFNATIIGLEIDQERVKNAQPAANPPHLTFQRGGFELAGLRPNIIRALNVLRQYEEESVAQAWSTMTKALAPGGWLVEGTCDELGRLATWALLLAGNATPLSLTLAANPSTLENPSSFAERLPKALIHHNVPGEPIHDLLQNLDESWHRAAPVSVFGAKQRWIATVKAFRDAGNEVLDGPKRWRLGEVTVPWPAGRTGARRDQATRSQRG
jgi:hypothetical protein